MNAKEFYNEVTSLTKAIGTTSSANQEADERSVENYVRGSYNTNTNNEIGGNTMSNTTEPDPQGDIAINKSIPTAGADKLISQETRPTDGATSVSDAPNNSEVVPNNATFDSSATSAVAPSKTDEVSTPETVAIAKGEKCPTCGAIAKGDDTDADSAIEKAASDDEVTETSADDETVEKSETQPEMKKSLWGGAFAPRLS